MVQPLLCLPLPLADQLAGQGEASKEGQKRSQAQGPRKKGEPTACRPATKGLREHRDGLGQQPRAGEAGIPPWVSMVPFLKVSWP